MGLFTRRKIPAATITWEPDGAGVHEWPAATTDDDGCAGECAYGTRFTLAAVPQAAITVWFYACYGPEETFMAGWRYEYSYACAGGPWTYSGWDCAPQLFATVEDADASALASAAALALAPRTAHQSQRELFGFFDWDGVPWANEVPA